MRCALNAVRSGVGWWRVVSDIGQKTCVFKEQFQNRFVILHPPWRVSDAKNLKSEVGFRLKCYLDSLDSTVTESVLDLPLP